MRRCAMEPLFSPRYKTTNKKYNPPPFGFSDVRYFVNKFESCEDETKLIVKYTPTEDDYELPYDEHSCRSDTVVWKIVCWKLGGVLARCIPNVTFGNLGLFAVVAGVLAPKMLAYLLLYPFFRLLFGTLYPAYASYKAVRTKNLKEYVKWMMYWIVFALFTCAETFTDVFLSWFPFYYEIKIVLVLWLLSPATRGSSILYRKFVHPALSRREQEIDDAIAKAKEQGYHTVLNLGSKGVNYATSVIMQTAIRNLNINQEVDESRPKRRAITHDDVTDSPMAVEYYQQQDASPKINELDSDPDFEPGFFDDDFKPTTSSARSRGNVVRKRRGDREKRARSNSSGRITRSQAKEINENVVLVD